MIRNKYTSEFKLQAVKLVIEEDYTVRAVSKELEIQSNSLYKWITEYEENGEFAFPGHGIRDYIYQNKMKQLEKENY